MSRRSTKGAIAIVALSLASATAAAAAQPPPPRTFALPAGASDISATATGKRLASEASARYAARGIKAGPLRVIKDRDGMLVAPVATRLATYEVTLGDGRKATAIAPLTPAAPAALTSPGETGLLAGPALSPAWRFVANDCFSRISDTWSWMDHCYTMYRLSNDGNSSFDWFALARHASMGPNSPWALTAGKIQATRYQSSAQTWADWNPKADWTGGSCSTVSIGVSLPVGGIGVSTERCPQVWDFWKSANGTQPDYSLTWIGPGTRADRELTFEISVRVAQGGWAQWVLPAEVHGGPL